VIWSSTSCTMCWSLQHDLVDSEFVGQQDNPLCDVLGEIADDRALCLASAIRMEIEGDPILRLPAPRLNPLHAPKTLQSRLMFLDKL